MEIKFTDLSYQTFGKYQFCTMDEKTGLWFADCDFELGGGLKKGALPSPRQDTPQLKEKAKELHEAAALKMANDALKPDATTPRRMGFFARLFARGSI